MAVDFWRSRALGTIAAKYDSQALQADALHFSTDIWSSGVVAFGLAMVVLAAERRTLMAYVAADPVAALFVAGVIIFVSTRLARRTIDALLDAAPVGARSKIITALKSVEGLFEVDRVRIRRAGNRYFADVSIGLARNVTFQTLQARLPTKSPPPCTGFFRMPTSWSIPFRGRLRQRIFSIGCARSRLAII